ncbi:MAG: hypothetical protein VX446_05320, partial [Bacteroidota bacterium]|nr:hypothetical protein [Bacteroidota bacterium]
MDVDVADAEPFRDFARVEAVRFTMFSPDELRRMAVTRVVTDQVYDKQQMPVPGGLNDARMGTMDRRYECSTCINDNKDCPGHPGIIELPAPFYCVGYLSETLAILRSVCPFCCRIKVEDSDFKVADVMESMDHSYTQSDKSFAHMTGIARTKKLCFRCAMPQPNYTGDGPAIKWEWDPDAAVLLADKGLWASYGRAFNAGDALSILRNVPDD